MCGISLSRSSDPGPGLVWQQPTGLSAGRCPPVRPVRLHNRPVDRHLHLQTLPRHHIRKVLLRSY